MNTKINHELLKAMRDFRLPHYEQLPDMGLYLEQTAKYINQTLEKLECIEVTGSMIRNYVKMGLVNNPNKKLYYRDQIAHLISITILKSVLPLEDIKQFFAFQRKVYSDQVAYDYFCMEMENILHARFGVTDSLKDIGVTATLEKEMLRSAITAVSHFIYIKACLSRMDDSSEE